VDIVAHRRKAGELRVFVMPPSDANEGPAILPMEKAMIETVGLWIENTVAHWQETDQRKDPANWWKHLKSAIGHKDRRR
jgi:hypothetical protein